MSGVDTYRGIAYQHAQTVLSALDVLESDQFAAIRVEGAEDAIDIELLDANGRVAVGKQAKVRAEGYVWADLVGLLRRWAAIDAPDSASFQFVTDGRLGPSGEQVRDALAQAAEGGRGPLAELLGEDPDGETVRRAARTTIVQDPGGAGSLLARAERKVMALLPSARSRADAEEQARSAVDALVRLLLHHACQPAAMDRLVSRDKICRALGIPLSATAALAWRGDVRERYLAAVTAEAPAAAVPARLWREEWPDLPREGVDALLAGGVTPAAVSGPTGAGKTTAARELMAAAAAQGRVVVVAHAETYLPGRLDALVADAVSDVLGREVPTLTGRQVLADIDTVVLIDGVSEVPELVRAALAEDLRAPVAAGRGARLVLLGRGLAAVRSVLPASCAPSLFRMEPFGRERREALTESVVGAGDGVARVVLARAEKALGDGAGNPMLLEMTLRLIASGLPFDDRAAVYGAFLDRLADKTGADGLGVAIVMLGVCFARLLDEGRRYADPYTWRRLLIEAADAQSAVIGPVDSTAVDEAARRSGLIVRLGQSEKVAAFHDSFADYLAGLALARGAVAFPAEVKPGDEERLLFAGQIGGMDRAFAEAVAARLPFSLPRLAALDRRGLGDGAPDEVSAVLRAVVPPCALVGADLWHAPGGRVVAIARPDGGGWLTDDDAARAAMASRPWVVGTGGPVDLAVRLWRLWLLSVLAGTGGAGLPRPRTAEEARDAVALHTVEAAAETDELVRAAVPAGHRAAVAAEIGSMGLTGQVFLAQDGRCPGPDWSVAYKRTVGIDVSVADGPAADETYPVHGTLGSLIGVPVSAIAAERVRKAIDKMAGGQWL